MSTEPVLISEQDCITSPQFSEDALALLYSDKHIDDLRFTSELGKYHRLTRTEVGGCCWQKDTVYRTVSEIRELTRQQSMIAEKPGKQNTLCSKSTIMAVETLVRFDQRTSMEVSQWDADPMVLNTPSGLIDLQTGKMSHGNPEAYCTKQTAVGPSSKTSDLWNRCLDTWTNGDRDLQEYLKRMAGYTLTGDTSEHQFFFLHGSGANGKGSFLNTVHGILGGYAKTAPPDVFTLSKVGERHPTSMAGLVGCRLALASETENNSRWAETQLKALVAGDPISARFMRQDFFEFTPQFKLLISGNHKPRLSAVDEAIRRRINLLPFDVIVPPEQRDTKLKAKLRDEWPNILGWMVEGCLEWQRDGLNPPSRVRVATDEYLDGEDVIGSWIEECCVLGPNCNSRSNDLHADWIAWCTTNEHYKSSMKEFLKALLDRPNLRKKHTNMGNLIEGIALRP
jgi:putative DNA primase/helicase